MLTEEQLVACRAAGQLAAARDRFVDPYVIAQCTAILDARGEAWAERVLGRDLSVRSMLVRNRPYLKAGEEYALIFADTEELRGAFDEVVADD